METEEQRIFKVVKSHLAKVLMLKPEQEAQVRIDQSMTELGANSVDRVEVVMYSMEELGVDVPRTELHGAKDLRGLVDILLKHTAKKA